MNQIISHGGRHGNEVVLRVLSVTFSACLKRQARVPVSMKPTSTSWHHLYEDQAIEPTSAAKVSSKCRLFKQRWLVGGLCAGEEI